MANLDDLFRRSQRTVRPATPPDGQWERIRAGVKDAPKKNRPLGFWWGIASGLLMGSVVSIAYSVATPGAVPVPSALLTDSIAPAAPPAEMVAVPQVITVYDTVTVIVYERVAAPPPPAVDLGRVAAYAKAFTSDVADTIAVEKEVPPLGPAAEVEINGLPPSLTSLHPLLLPANPSLRDLPTKLETRKVVPAALGWKGFTRVEQPDVPRGRWEFGVHMTPEVQSNIAVVSLYSKVENDIRPPEIFDLEGDTETLYYQGTENVPQSQRVTPFLLTSLQVARQFSSGWRIGLGYVVYSSQKKMPANSDFLPRLFEGEYYGGHTHDDEAHFATLTAGYTIWKRRKIQLNIGGLFMGQFRRDNSLYEYLYSRDERRLYSVGSRQDIKGNYLFRVAVYPQVNLHYHLNDRLSFGTEIVPGLGLGARYKLY